MAHIVQNGQLDSPVRTRFADNGRHARLPSSARIRHLHDPEQFTGQRPGRSRGAVRAARIRPGHLPGPPVPAAVPGHLDAAVLGGRPHRADPGVRQRAEPAAAPACRARPGRGEPRPALGRPLRPGAGAGGFWDAIEAMGGPRRTPGEAVQRSPRRSTHPRHLGRRRPRAAARARRVHRVAGAKRGPAPAQAIPIVLGAYGPRMLRLVGRQADGWLPTWPDLPPMGYRGNSIIDAAAQDVRPGSEIDPPVAHYPRRRHRRVHACFRWTGARRRVGAAVGGRADRVRADRRVSTFVLSSDDAGLLRAFAEEVAPKVRAAVDRARAS